MTPFMHLLMMHFFLKNAEMSKAADELGLPLPTSNESLPRKRNTLIKAVEKDYNIFDSSENSSPEMKLFPEEEQLLLRYLQDSSYSFSMSAHSTTFPSTNPPIAAPMQLLSEEEEDLLFQYIQSYSFSFSMSAPSTTFPSTNPPIAAHWTTFPSTNPPIAAPMQLQPTQVPFLELTPPPTNECCECPYDTNGEENPGPCCGTCVTTGNPTDRGCKLPRQCEICEWKDEDQKNHSVECCGTCIKNKNEAIRGCFECTGSIVDVQYEVLPPNGVDQFLSCELPNGKNLRVEVADKEFIKKKFGKGKYKSGDVALEFDDDATFDFAKGEILSKNEPVLRKKKVKGNGNGNGNGNCNGNGNGNGNKGNNGKGNDNDRRLQTQEVVGNCGSYLGGSCAGTRTVLVVRVIAADKSTTASESQLAESIFENPNDSLNLQSWYEQCSYNQLNFVPATGDGINGGVTTVSVTSSTTDGDSVMNNDIAAALNTKFGVSSPNQIANHVMYCLPAGTMKSVAYAYVNFWRSVYSDNWCTYVSAQAHEIGHNLALAHSGDPTAIGNAVSYGDKSGTMGFGYEEDDGPIQCFNAPKNWQLGWYDDKHIAVSYDGWEGNLIGLADYGKSNVAEEDMVIAKVDLDESYYVSFNAKRGINSGTQEGGDQVMVHRRELGTDYGASDVLAHLNSGEFYTYGNFKVTVNSINLMSDPARANVKIERFDISPPCFTGTISITIIPDPYPGETSWDIIDDADNIVASGGSTGALNIVLGDGYYTFSIYDQSGDGICCQFGNGSYTFQIGSTLVKTGGEFGLQESTQFGICNGALATTAPTKAPSASPTISTTSSPTGMPTKGRAASPSGIPSIEPSFLPSFTPSMIPTSSPSLSISTTPSVPHSDIPSTTVSDFPSFLLSSEPTLSPSDIPSVQQSMFPSGNLSMIPSKVDLDRPSQVLSEMPTKAPTQLQKPSKHEDTTNASPSNIPSVEHSSLPSFKPSTIPSSSPSFSSSITPSVLHSELPSTSQSPSALLSTDPSVAPSDIPSIQASVDPSVPLSLVPSVAQSDQPSQVPSNAPTDGPSISTSSPPTGHPTSSKPSQIPSHKMSIDPTTSSTVEPSFSSSNSPTDHPTSSEPSQVPSYEITIDPTSIQPFPLPTSRPTFWDPPKCRDQTGRQILTWKGRRRKCNYIASNKRKLCDRGNKYCANESGKLFRDYSGPCCDSCNVYYNEPRCTSSTDTSPPTVAPVTSSPTIAPFTSSPTIACKPTTIKVKLNDEINENGLMLRKYNRATRKFSIKVYAKGRKHFNEANKTYTFDVGCLETKACYRFTFRDKDRETGKSDGFLSGNGYVKVVYGGEKIRYSKFNKPKKNLKRIRVKFGDRCPIFD